MPRIIVIGAGVMGASVAYRLATAGASVTVLEAGAHRWRHFRMQLRVDEFQRKDTARLS